MDRARLMYAQIQEVRVPAWIIGCSTAAAEHVDVPAKILAVYPVRQPVERIGLEEFNAGIAALRQGHCPPRLTPPAGGMAERGGEHGRCGVGGVQ